MIRFSRVWLPEKHLNKRERKDYIEIGLQDFCSVNRLHFRELMKCPFMQKPPSPEHAPKITKIDLLRLLRERHGDVQALNKLRRSFAVSPSNLRDLHIR